MSNDITIANDLPPQIIALNHATLDEAMELCERAHAIAIPSATVDEQGCRSGLEQANKLYASINELSKALEQHRLAEGRKINAIKERVDAAVKAAVVPLEDQRSRLGTKLVKAKADLDRVIAEAKAAAERERLRREEESRAAAEAARKAEIEAKAAADAAAAKLAELAAAAAASNEDPLPDDGLVAEAKAAADTAAAAAATAEAARTVAIDRVFDAVPAPYVAPAPRMAVKGKTEYSLAIDDLAKIPREFCGVQLWKLDEPALLKLLKAKAAVPGCHLVETEGTSAKGRSSAFAV